MVKPSLTLSILFISGLFLWISTSVSSFTVHHIQSSFRRINPNQLSNGHDLKYPKLSKSPLFSSSSTSTTTPENDIRTTLKQSLLQSIQKLRKIQERDGDISIDFGVKGGELNSTTRAPRKVDYYQISNEAGETSDEIFTLCEQLSENTPNPNPTEFLGDKVNGEKAPLNGEWKLLFTTAADASFSSNSTRGDARAKNIVDASKGRITNVIEFIPSSSSNSTSASSSSSSSITTAKPSPPPLVKQLNVVIQAIASSPTRVNLTFRYVKVDLTKFFFLPIRWSLYIPVPGPFITRCVVFLNKFVKFWKRKSKNKDNSSDSSIQEPPKAYFDILYLDQQLRIHKTGEDNLFVQAKEAWEEAKPLLN